MKIKVGVFCVALVAALFTALALPGCGSSDSAAPSSGQSESGGSSVDLPEAPDSKTVAPISFKGIPGASFKPVNNFNEPSEMSGADVEKAERAIRAYTPSEGEEFLLVNNAKSFYYYDQLDGDVKALYEGLNLLLQDPTEDHVLSVTLDDGTSSEQFEDDYYLAAFCLQYDHPEYFWLYNALETDFNIGISDDKVYISLDRPYKNFEREMTAFNDAAAEFLADIDMNASDQDKALAIHNKLCEMVEYDYEVAENTDAETSDLAHTAYGALVENSSGEAHHAVCDGYSLAYEYLLQQAGVEATVLVGDAGEDEVMAGPHAWSLVKLGDDWYEVDSTWDDGMTEFETALDELKESDPDNESIPYYEQAFADESYYDKLTHYLYNVTTEEITGYTPSSDYTYTFENGASLTIPDSSVHVRASELKRYGHYSDMVKLAPEAKGTAFAYRSK